MNLVLFYHSLFSLSYAVMLVLMPILMSHTLHFFVLSFVLACACAYMSLVSTRF